MTKYMLMEGQPLTGEYTIPQTGHWMIETRNVDGSRVDLFKKMSPELAEIIPGKIDNPWCVVHSFEHSGCMEYFFREGAILQAISEPGSFLLLTSPAPFNQHPEYVCRFRVGLVATPG